MGFLSLAAHPVGQTGICRQGTKAVGAVGKVWSRDTISQTGVVEHKDDAKHFDSNLPAKLSGDGGADVDSSANLLRELELLSDAPGAASPPTKPPVQQPNIDPPSAGQQSAHSPSANSPSVMRSKRMSSVSEQDHLNPRDPLYYAPRSLRERSASRGGSLEKPFSAASFDSQLESAVSDALRHPLDPEVMHDPDMESKKAMWTIAARFAAAIGVAALVALFFVVAVPGSRQSDGEQSSTLSSLAQSFKNALPQSAETASKPAINEFQAILAATPASAPPASEPASESSGQLLQQFMQWREKPDPATPRRANP